MRRIAFFAPLKAPDHPVPSGDRQMARNLLTALRSIGAEVTNVSALRIYDGLGSAGTQQQLQSKADAEINRLIRELTAHPVSAWVTYHNYYKSPDLIGPVICKSLNIPYVLIEATRARKRLNGPWSDFAAKSETACDAADVIFYMTQQDKFALERDKPEGQVLLHLSPFLPVSVLPAPKPRQDTNRLLSVGMMRSGDKLSSYRIIAEALQHLTDLPWQLDIVGDGPAREQVKTAMADFGSRVRFLGQLQPNELADIYGTADLFFWPGVNEAYGMVYLEAQASGLPVIAQSRPGVQDVLAPGEYPAPEDGIDALANSIRSLLCDATLRTELGHRARDYVCDHHLLNSAAGSLSKMFDYFGGLQK